MKHLLGLFSSRPLPDWLAFWRRGLWPFTPDPAEPGLHFMGIAATGTPLLISGNSRHELRRLRRAVAPAGMEVLALNTHGLDLYLALTAGKLTAEAVAAELEQREQLEVDAEAELTGSKQALLPYPVWQALGGREIEAPRAWQLKGGPADSRDLAAFLARGQQLTEEMKRPRSRVGERLAVILPHAGLLLLVAAVPLLWTGLATFLAGAAAVLATAVLLATLWPLLFPRGREWVKGVAAGTATGIGVLVIGWAVGGVELFLLALATLPLTGAWLAVLAMPHMHPLARAGGVQ
jgi:hypothetical protein